MLELLEPRRLCAVDAFVDDGTLIIRGGDGADQIIISRTEFPTTLNVLTISDGGSYLEPQAFPGVTRGVRVILGGGDDSVMIHGVRVAGTINVDGGAGDDRLTLHHTRVRGDLEVAAGDGEDRVWIRDATVQGALRLDGGPGRDRFAVSRVLVKSDFRLLDTAGSTLVTLNRMSVRRDSSIQTGNSIDRLTITSSTVFGDAAVRTLGQDDAIFVRGSVFRGQSPFDAGTGDNHVDREVILGWDFNDGEQGWRSGISDITTTPVDFDNPNLFTGFGFARGIRPLPDDVGIAENAFFLSSRNSSDDAFVFLFKALNRDLGIVANARYLLSFTVVLAGKEELGLGGIGGSPSESVYLKVGGSSIEPRLLPAEPGATVSRLNIDIGNQSRGGMNASVAGNIANDIEALTPLPENFGFRLFRRMHTHPWPIATGANGDLHLVVGTDSGFEGITELYYKRITVTLTPSMSVSSSQE